MNNSLFYVTFVTEILISNEKLHIYENSEGQTEPLDTVHPLVGL